MFNPIQFYEFGKSRGLVDFVSNWKTDNLTTGSSSNNQVKLPLASNGMYDFLVDWGDGISNNITSFNQAEVTHTYSSIGTYKIKIKGTLSGWGFLSAGDRDKILNIENWGVLRFSTISSGNAGAFSGCTKLTLNAVTDVVNLNQVTDGRNFFSGCTSLTTINRVNEWNVSSFTNITDFFRSSNFNDNISNWNLPNCTNFSGVFRFNIGFNNPLPNFVGQSCTTLNNIFNGSTVVFNQNIGAWDIRNVANGSFLNFMNNMTPAKFSATNLDAIYNGWSTRPVKPNVAISFGTAKYTSASSAGRSILTSSPNNWVITDGGI